jgi:hypothetical protein
MKSLVYLISSSGTTNPFSPFAAAIVSSVRPRDRRDGVEKEGVWLSVCSVRYGDGLFKAGEGKEPKLTGFVVYYGLCPLSVFA